MMRTQPPGFRWLVGCFALVAALAFGFRYRSSDEPADLVLGVLCLVAAGYWLIFDREPAPGDLAEDSVSGGEVDDEPRGDALGDQDPTPDQRRDRRHPG